MAPVIPWLRIALALVFCLGLAVAAILLLRRRHGAGAGLAPRLSEWLQTGHGKAPAPLDLVGRLRLSATAQVVVLEWEATRYLVHLSATGATLIDRRPVVAQMP